MTKKQDVAETSGAKEANASDHDAKPDDRKVCGIVMPIAAMGEEYPEAHWSRVLLVLQRAIDRAGLRYQLVWENPEVDVIQTAILQNIFENDVVICDVSNLNPNVMLETGLRLSTKRPTIIVTDKQKRPPFDISIISYIDYPRDLEYNATENFINKLVRKIKEVVKAVDEDRYKPYIEEFRFETVQPDSVTVTTDEYVREKLDDLTGIVRRLVRIQEQSLPPSTAGSTPAAPSRPRQRQRYKVAGILTGNFSRETAERVEREIDAISQAYCLLNEEDENIFTYIIYVLHSVSDIPSKLEQCKAVIDNAENGFIFA